MSLIVCWRKFQALVFGAGLAEATGPGVQRSVHVSVAPVPGVSRGDGVRLLDVGVTHQCPASVGARIKVACFHWIKWFWFFVGISAGGAVFMVS